MVTPASLLACLVIMAPCLLSRPILLRFALRPPPQVAESVWEPCQGANISYAQTKQLTVSGQECVFPGVYAGQTITECTALVPGAPLMCPVSGVGCWVVGGWVCVNPNSGTKGSQA